MRGPLWCPAISHSSADLRLGRAEFSCLFALELHLHLLHQPLVGRGPNDLAELGPVVIDQAHTLHDDVIDLPVRVVLLKAVQDRDLLVPLRDDLAPDLGILSDRKSVV